MCGDAGDVFLFAAPAHPVRGQSLRMVAVTDHIVDAQLTLTPPASKTASAASA
jgi:hypothetical protein